ncbi:transposase [Loigolactobacillus coryniformis]|uniref:transposase n=1 Tax=Loigolactobacillus coryniformis TaxID=1610 RepID=UPI003A8D1AF9
MGQCTLAGKRRAQAMRAIPAVALELIKQVRANGIKAKYVLFDSWFASPKMFAALNDQKLIGIGLFKRTKKIYYRYRGRQYTVKTRYQRLRQSHRQQRADYLYSCVIQTATTKLPLRLVFVAKRHCANDYLVLATTQTKLTPAAIIKLYRRRWQIENYFKAAKQYLRLDQTQIQDYDGLCAHMAVTIMLAWQQRRQPDDPTIGDAFYQLDTLLPIIDLVTAISQLLGELLV